MNAEPEAFLQLTQWQIRKVMGSPMISYLIDLHKQDPDRTVDEEDMVLQWMGRGKKAERIAFGTDD